jgi:3-polyprenyl-4-hydroxybenzoate decarboxylase
MRILLGVSGGIAAYKAVLLLRLLREQGHAVRVLPTASALRFVGAPTFEALSGEPVTAEVFADVPEVPHVALGQGADLVVVAPATADLLARAAAGRADDLLTSALLTARCPVVMAPAMHTEMWEHPATRANVATLRERGVVVIEPDAGRLTGADTGPGRLPEPEEVARVALDVVAGRAAPAEPGSMVPSRRSGMADRGPTPIERVSLSFRHCAGFRVQSANGHVGFVEEVLFGCNPDQPAALAIRSGLFHERLEFAPIEGVEEIMTSERRIVLRAAAPTVVVSES